MVSWKKFNDWFLIKAVDRLGKIRAMAHCPGESNQAPQSAEDVLHSTVVPEVTSLTSEYSQESWIWLCPSAVTQTWEPHRDVLRSADGHFPRQAQHRTAPTSRSEAVEEHLSTARRAKEPLEREVIWETECLQGCGRGGQREGSRLCRDPCCQYFDLKCTNLNVLCSLLFLWDRTQWKG